MTTLTEEQFAQKKARLLEKIEARLDVMLDNGDEAGIKAIGDAMSAAIAEMKKMDEDDTKVVSLVKDVIRGILDDTPASSERTDGDIN